MASVTVDYILNIKGNASKALDELKTKMSAFAAESGKIARAMNQNQNLAMFESMASLFAQMGGTISQVSIIATTAARPLTVLSKMIGGAGMAALGATVGIALLAAGVVKATTATMGWISEMGKLRAKLIEQGWLYTDDARNLVDYEKAMERLSVSSAKLRVELADKLAPAFQELIDAGTGFVRTLGDMDSGAETTYGSISKLLQTIGTGLAVTPVGAAAFSWGSAIKSYADTGQPSNERNFVDPQAVRALLAPFDPYMEDIWNNDAIYGPTQEQMEIGGQITQEKEKKQREAKALQDELDRSYDAYKEAWQEAMQKIDQAITKQVVEEWDEAAKEAKAAADKAKEAAQKQKEIMSFSGGLGGTLQNTGNPVMQAIATVLNPVRLVADGFGMLVNEIFSLDDLLGSTLDNALRVFGELPEEIFNIFGLLLPRFIRAMPEIVSQFILLAPAIVWELVRASPIILGAMIEAILQLPAEFVRQFKEAFNLDNMLNAFKGVFGKGGTIATSARSLIDLKGEDKSIFGVKIPSFDTGGMVAQTGLVYAHKGERVLNRQETRNYNGGSVGAINVYSTADARAIAEELRNKLGPYGLNLSLAPRV